MPITESEKVRENRLRRMANRQGLGLSKSRTRDFRAIDFDRWMIFDIITNTIVAGTGGTGRPNMTLDEVERYLTEDD
jgi:hypothetical protein